MPAEHYTQFKRYEIVFVIDTTLPIRDIATYLGRSYFSISQLIYKLRKLGYDVKHKRRSKPE